MSDLEIMRVLVASTAHVEKREADDLATGMSPGDGISDPIAMPNGWLLWIGDDGESESDLSAMSHSFERLVQLAWANKLTWLRLDSDGPVYDGISTHDW